MSCLKIRHVIPADTNTIVNMIKALAKFGKLEDQCVTTPELIEKALFSEHPDCYAILAFEVGDDGTEEPVGFALYFHNFSTFTARRGLYLEDLFVLESRRGKGYGKQIMKYLAKTALDKGCARFEWSVLDWNPAIKFYERIGAKVFQEWRACRLDGQALVDLANS